MRKGVLVNLESTCKSLRAAIDIHLSLIASIETDPEEGKAEPAGSPAIVLLHGSSTWGRRLPLYQVLALHWQRLGYTLLVPDARGYGDSEDPPVVDVRSFDFAQDVIAAVDFLGSDTPVDASRVYLVGHSFGGGVALAGQAREPRIKKLVLIGPPRRFVERFLGPDASHRDFFLRRWQSRMQLGQPLDFETFGALYESMVLENRVDYFASDGHVPVFLTDGSKEPNADRAFLSAAYRQMSPPAVYWTVEGTDHYLSTGFLLGRSCYNRRVADALAHRVDRWLRDGS